MSAKAKEYRLWVTVLGVFMAAALWLPVRGIAQQQQPQNRQPASGPDILKQSPTNTTEPRPTADGKPLPSWHYLISGSRETVHEAGQSTRGWTVSEVDAGELEYHLVDRGL